MVIMVLAVIEVIFIFYLTSKMDRKIFQLEKDFREQLIQLVVDKYSQGKTGVKDETQVDETQVDEAWIDEAWGDETWADEA